uniref:Uncharacterized protein n=1 Tax=viral metagenome TaxID=1070528 RepID=A0A6H1ZGI3_9ZZZZ
MNDEEKKEKKRTIQQNKALHKYFELIAKALNDSGQDMRAVLKPEVEIPWSKESVKEFLWKPILKLQLGKDSTTKMTTKDIDIIFDTFNRHISKFGVYEDFPSIDNLDAIIKAYNL